jgi:hypothetical protein
MISKKLPLIFTFILIFIFTTAGLKGNVYKSKGVTYQIGSLSHDWVRLKDEGVDLVFWNAIAKRTIVVNSVCQGIRDEPLRILTAHLFYGFSDVNIKKQEKKIIAGVEALETKLVAKLDNKLVVLDLYVLRQGKCVFDLQYFASPKNFEGGSDEFEKFVGDFTILKVK